METIKNWQDIIDNLREFSYVIQKNDSATFNRISSFYHWYYFPNEKAFAPSKFIGYKSTTIDNYSGEGNGGETQKVLINYFDKISKESKQFKELYEKLDLFTSSIGKKVSSKTFSGTGGIYIPKDEFINLNSEYSQQLFNVSSDDINSFEDEAILPSLEGGLISKLVNVYERDSKLRTKAIQIHGLKCVVCKFDFEQTYGVHGKQFIEVHHLKPLYKLISPTLINPETDMTVLCANCHRMIHRNKSQPLTVDELTNILKIQ